MATAGDVFDGVRALLNDRNSAIYQNALIVEYLNVVWNGFCDELIRNSAPILTEVTSPVIEVPAAATTLTLPSDLVTPMSMYERPNNSAYTDWVPVNKRSAIDPRTTPLERIDYWVWREGAIEFPAPTTAREVYLTYKKRPANFTVTTSTAIPDSTYATYLKYATAQLIAATIMQNSELEQFLATLAEKELVKVLTVVAHLGQSNPVRKRPFNAFRR